MEAGLAGTFGEAAGATVDSTIRITNQFSLSNADVAQFAISVGVNPNGAVFLQKLACEYATVLSIQCDTVEVSRASTTSSRRHLQETSQTFNYETSLPAAKLNTANRLIRESSSLDGTFPLEGELSNQMDVAVAQVTSAMFESLLS